jgi:integrase
MFNDTSAANGKSTYVKVASYPGLYRHSRSGRYYGFKKVHGKRCECSLRTTDRKIAERRLQDWIRNLETIDRELERTTLRGLLQKFVAANQGKSAKTQATNASIIAQLRRSWPGGMDIEVRNIKPSHLDQWLALQESRLKNTTYNRYSGLLRQMFGIAVRDRIIAQSPFEGVQTSWKQPQEPVRLVPTSDQFMAIVNSIRSQRFTRHAKQTADFVEFLGLAGLGQAEAASLTWNAVDLKKGRLSCRRHKTGTRFYVPMYPDLRELLERLRKQAGNVPASARVFAIKDAKKALKAACDRLGYAHFSQRSIRRCLIRKLWRSGIDKKLIAKWQGHQDGGQLIIDTYTEAFGDDDAEYERQQLAKLGATLDCDKRLAS